nr:glycosyltransferase family 2 protein [uncultured Mucilaginibacter sp.]
MNSELVSVIMPAYNAQKYIAESMESVICQTYPIWELIIIDDGSTDDTAAIVKQYQTKDDRIKYIYQKNAGQGRAKSTGIKISKGEYIAFLDADDLWLKEKLSKSLTAIKSSDASLLFTNYGVFDKNVNDGEITVMQVGDATFEGRESIITFLNYNQIPNLTVLTTREAIIGAGDFTDIVVAEDYEMWLRMLKNGCTFMSISTCLSLYRVHNESITARDRFATFEIIQIIKNFGQQYQEFAVEAKKIAVEKIKYWLYNGYNTTPKKFRVLISKVYNQPLASLFFCLSYVLPIQHLRKIVIRLS